MEVREIDPAELDPSLGRLRQLPERSVQSMMSSLRGKGQLSPLVAARQGETLVLVDGFIRQAAALRLGLQSVFVTVVELSVAQMKAQMYLRNRERGLLLVEECRLVQELYDADGLTQVQIGDLLEKHKSWVSRRLSLQRALSPRLVEDMALGLLGAGVLRRLALLPAGNQDELVAVARREQLGPKDTSDFIDLWRRTGDPEARRYVLDHPTDALRRARGRSDQSSDPRLTDSARELLRALGALSISSLRIRRRVQQGLGEIAVDVLERIATERHKANEQCRCAFGELGQWIAKQSGEGADGEEKT
jgi:ParB-like chromosome segregation protein Spo0J